MGLLYAATALEKATGVYVENHFNFLSQRRIRAQKRTEKRKKKNEKNPNLTYVPLRFPDLL